MSTIIFQPVFDALSRARDILSQQIVYQQDGEGGDTPEQEGSTQRRVTATSGLNLRDDHSTGGGRLLTIPYGATIQLVEGVEPIQDGDYTWVQVSYTDEDGNVHTGWVAESFGDDTYLGDVREIVEGDALTIAPINNPVQSGWEYGAREYKIPAGTVIGDGTYAETTTIDQATFNNLSAADQAKVILDPNTGQYVIPAGTTFEGTTYSYDTYIGEDEYNALSTTDQAEATYIGMHPGVDISSGDTAMTANAGGTVYMYPGEEGFGNYIVMETVVNGETYYQVFAHMDSFAEGLENGQYVEAGTSLGEMGSTGNSTGNHVHWEVRTADGINVETVDGVTTHTISIWYPKDQASLDTNFVSPDNFAGMLEAQNQEETMTDASQDASSVTNQVE